MRSLQVRLSRHAASSIHVARWLASRNEVARVLHPALALHPDQAIFQRDFTGSSGLFGCVLKPQPSGREYLRTLLESLRLLGMGFSWGGFKSLVVFTDMRGARAVMLWKEAGSLLRFHIDLEDSHDLISDLDNAFERANALNHNA